MSFSTCGNCGEVISLSPCKCNQAKTLEPDCYGDGNVYRGVRSKDSEIQTIHIDSTAKTLTDEEIDEVYGIAMQGGPKGYEKVREFARAILKKAQEK